MAMNPPAMWEPRVQPPSPGGRHGNPLRCPCLENPRGHRSLACCSPWGLQRLGHAWATKHHTASRILKLSSVQGSREKVGWIETVALTSIHDHVWSRGWVGSCYLALRAQLGAVWWPRGVEWRGWEGGSRRRGCVYTYSWFAIVQQKHNTVKQLNSN